jgi:hypothetical protein
VNIGKEKNWALLPLEIVTQMQQIHLDKDETEEAGLIKIDILSNRGLAQLVDADPLHWSLLDYPSRDALTEELFAQGNTIGLTFGESRGMRKLFIELRPRMMEDIAIALALIRPAAAVGGRKAAFLERWKHGAEDLGDPLRKPILFDDDAIVLIKLALECDDAAADKWRKVFSKQNPKGRVEFRKELYAKGIPTATQNAMMDDLDQLALYSFCKSHAISYAQLVWALAYQKAHNPHLFWIASLNHCHSEYRKWVHWREARCSGLLLTREKGPYVLGKRKGQPAIVSTSAKGEQMLLFGNETSDEQSVRDAQQLGYWLNEQFLPNCGIWTDEQQTLYSYFGSKPTKQVKFRGLIATGRILRRDGTATLLTIGVANRQFIDLVIPDKARNDLFRYAAVEGKGKLMKQGKIESITVDSISPVSYKQLLRKNL